VKVILDSNLLLLLVVGLASRDYIKKHKRLSSFIDEDFTLLVNMLNQYSGIIVTPNTLTETSNLVGHAADPVRGNVYRVFHKLVDAPGYEECFVATKEAIARTEFVRLGLTDATLLCLAAESYTLLTADFDLYWAAVNCGLKSENFNHYRNL
jgi:hypothetical protein